MNGRTRPSPKPKWLKKRLAAGPGFEPTRSFLRENALHTVCEEARCPNLRECFSRGTATFLILGNRCTRNCRFCAITQGRPDPPDRLEAGRVAAAAEDMNLAYVVVTSVTRDDLADGGASCFAETVTAIRRRVPGAAAEILVPDFQGDREALLGVLRSGPAVLNHNMETVSRLYPVVRPGADYDRSLGVLARAAAFSPSIPVKTGLMLGLGETAAELKETLKDIYRAGARIITLGQYLQPAPGKHPVARFVPPEEFEQWKEEARATGFAAVASGPFVRSSYDAAALHGSFLKTFPD
ncbi:MAG: lipoyl synthase [Syntrophales bacterium]|jgi:lipoic acid synthetase|nr:lipoyl synthase [Syntrophales bacterium]MCK9527324.1 lipoyl synthase [Syntrophales bacterium]MDX9921206.1 lipoyl synthase [Syntrophales bacterium]